MSIDNPVETLIGAGVLAVAIGFGVYVSQSGGAGPAAGAYEVSASFRAANGVVSGTDVRIAGVKVGSVSAVELDPSSYRAKATLLIRDGVELSDDTIAKIDSEGLLGGAYIALEPGASADMLGEGDEIDFTQGSVSLLDLVNKFGGGGS